ncbi:uncharacterized protein LOC123705987 [Colias croceus]|uniref:uncharacterized protein LOC123705987 n=1 Tax=Colias crocea TaxID=72248 RepID=UPI001E27FEC4|nr:uncharacterized protein LOC123705987 [Colias croceus]
MRNKPKTSRFNLIMKRTASKESKSKNSKRRGIELAKKLRKKRRLVVNKHRRATGDKLMRVRKTRRLIVNKRRQVQHKTTTTKDKESACHWGYECSDPTDLDTCQLFTKCKDQKEAKEDNIKVPHNSDEHSKAIQQFRKMLGISLVDEEVEKILESRIISMKPNKLGADERIESLSEYFNSIVIAEEQRTTTALSPSADDEDTTEINNDNATKEQNQKMIENDFKNESKEKHEMRKSLKFMIKTTPVSS